MNEPFVAAETVPAETEALVTRFHQQLNAIRTQVRRVIVGQEDVVEHLLLTLLIGGHCLITGMPGTAKTLLVRTLANALGLTFKRVQFTPDLMPTDITGTDIIEEDITTGHRRWTFVPGPIFTHVLLADEINRTPPKTQAALLEAMQEHSVTVRGTTHKLAPPFLVLATQNPIELEGTYPLPEAQLDRFVFNVLLDYLSAEDEVEVVERNTMHMELPTIEACTSAAEIMEFQWLVRQVPVSDEMQRYAVDLIRATRPGEAIAPERVRRYVRYGASVRATQFLCLAAKARALTQGRYHVTPEDLRSLMLPVLRHRVLTNYQAESDGVSVDDVLKDVVER
ncbi:MAG TPA: MoxR family ATPase [Povalibacter sp.]|nr:MoxR family ATPase [Povalibacter sp.]